MFPRVSGVCRVEPWMRIDKQGVREGRSTKSAGGGGGVRDLRLLYRARDYQRRSMPLQGRKVASSRTRGERAEKEKAPGSLYFCLASTRVSTPSTPESLTPPPLPLKTPIFLATPERDL